MNETVGLLDIEKGEVVIFNLDHAQRILDNPRQQSFKLKDAKYKMVKGTITAIEPAEGAE